MSFPSFSDLRFLLHFTGTGFAGAVTSPCGTPATPLRIPGSIILLCEEGVGREARWRVVKRKEGKGKEDGCIVGKERKRGRNVGRK